MGDVGRKMVTWMITSRNNRAERQPGLLILGSP